MVIQIYEKKFSYLENVSRFTLRNTFKQLLVREYRSARSTQGMTMFDMQNSLLSAGNSCGLLNPSAMEDQNELTKYNKR